MECDAKRMRSGFEADSKRMRSGLEADAKRMRSGFEADSKRMRSGFEADAKRMRSGSEADVNVKRQDQASLCCGYIERKFLRKLFDNTVGAGYQNLDMKTKIKMKIEMKSVGGRHVWFRVKL